jgi:hypothetical protein
MDANLMPQQKFYNLLIIKWKMDMVREITCSMTNIVIIMHINGRTRDECLLPS